MFSNPISAYQQIERESDVRGADPHRLIMLLFEGAIAALFEAEEMLSQKKLAEKSRALVKVIAIINDGLISSLNVEDGGELAQNLLALYKYIIARVLHANVQNDTNAIVEARELLEEIGGAWREMGENLKASPPPAP